MFIHEMSVSNTVFFTSSAQFDLMLFIDKGGGHVYEFRFVPRSNIPYFTNAVVTQIIEPNPQFPSVTPTFLAYVSSALRIVTLPHMLEIPIVSVQKTTFGQTLNGYIVQAKAYAVIGAINSTTTEILDRFAKIDPMRFSLGGFPTENTITIA